MIAAQPGGAWSLGACRRRIERLPNATSNNNKLSIRLRQAPSGVGEEHPELAVPTRPAVPEYWRWTHLPRLLTDIDHRGQLGCPSSEAGAGREAADAQFSEVR